MVLTVDSDAKTIKAAYRIAGLKTHPDKTGSDGGEFLEVQQAFDYLTGRETAPKDEQDLLEERVSRDQSQFAIMPLHETSNGRPARGVQLCARAQLGHDGLQLQGFR